MLKARRERDKRRCKSNSRESDLVGSEALSLLPTNPNSQCAVPPVTSHIETQLNGVCPKKEIACGTRRGNQFRLTFSCTPPLGATTSIIVNFDTIFARDHGGY